MTSLIHFNDFGLKQADLAFVANGLIVELSNPADENQDIIVENIALLDYVTKRHSGAVDTYRALNCLNRFIRVDNDDIREASLRAMMTLIDLKKPFLDKDFVQPLIDCLDTRKNSSDIVHITCLLLQAVYRNRRPIDKNDKTLKAIVSHEQRAIASNVSTYITALVKTAITYNPHLAEHLKPIDRQFYQNGIEDEARDQKIRDFYRELKI